MTPDTDAGDTWQCIECARSPPVVSFPPGTDRSEYMCRRCRETPTLDRGA